MKQKTTIKIIIAVALLMVFTVPTQAQLLNNFGHRLSEKINNRIEHKTDEAMDKGLDKAEEGLKSPTSSSGKQQKIAWQGSKEDCGNYYLLMKKGLVQITVYNKKSKPSLTLNYHITEIQPIANGKESHVNIEAFDEKGKKMTSGKAVYKCVNGTLMMDMKAAMPYQNNQNNGMSAQGAAHSFMDYPPHMSVGQKLPDAVFHMKLQGQNVFMSSATFTAKKRVVEGKESVTTPAGIWTCFRISYTAAIKVMGIPMRYKVTEWFAPGFGIVKSLSRNKKGKMISYSLLTKVQQ